MEWGILNAELLHSIRLSLICLMGLSVTVSILLTSSLGGMRGFGEQRE